MLMLVWHQQSVSDSISSMFNEILQNDWIENEVDHISRSMKLRFLLLYRTRNVRVRRGILKCDCLKFSSQLCEMFRRNIFGHSLRSKKEHLTRRPSFFNSGGGTLSTATTTGRLYQPQMIGNGDCKEIGGMKIGRGNRSTRRKPAPAPLCLLQIPHD
jgi:hypothetical protein